MNTKEVLKSQMDPKAAKALKNSSLNYQKAAIKRLQTDKIKKNT